MNCSRKKFGPNFKEILNFLPKKLSLSSQKYEFGIPDPGSRGQKGPNPGSRIRIRNTACITEYRIQKEKTSAAKLMYIKSPIYQFFYMALGLNDFDGGIMILMRANPFRGPYIKRLIFSFFVSRTVNRRKSLRVSQSLKYNIEETTTTTTTTTSSSMSSADRTTNNTDEPDTLHRSREFSLSRVGRIFFFFWGGGKVRCFGSKYS